MDLELIIGRLDGVTADAAKALVDRAQAAEENGIYGKFYGSKFHENGVYGYARWFDYESSSLVYGTNETKWRYPMGLFGELATAGSTTGIHHSADPDCLGHLDSSASSAAGKSPQECVVKLTNGGGEPPPATTSSRQPWVDDAIVYHGSLDGQPTTGSFERFTYWRKDATCTEPLCIDTADPDACRAASTDVFRELNTECMGVADGFVGYNFQSYPVSFFAVWPTAWYQNTNDKTWAHRGGGEVRNLSLPEVREDIGFDVDFSLWFRNADAIDAPQCLADAAALADGVLTDCSGDLRRVVLNNRTDFSARLFDADQPQQYTVRFW